MDLIYSIVVSYNGMRNNWLKRCLESLSKSVIKTQIVVIDNASSDDSLSFIKENYTNVYLIEKKENLGFGGANNIGLSLAIDHHADYVFLLNQDAFVNPDTLERLVGIAKENLDYGVLSPIHLNGNGTYLDKNFMDYIQPNICPNLISDSLNNITVRSVYSTDFVCAAAWLITKACLRKVGGFSSTFYHYGEDNNYCDRVHFKGLKIGIVPSCFIMHDRENRKINHNSFFKISEKVKWALIEGSNPNLSYSIKNIINRYKVVFLKKMFLCKINDAKIYFSAINNIQKDIPFIQKNKSLSCNDNSYIFLEIN